VPGEAGKGEVTEETWSLEVVLGYEAKNMD
jgi:hypothetical protein